MSSERVLLIAGGGTLGTYAAKELLLKGCRVDIICLEDKISDNENLRFFKERADLPYMEKFLEGNKYDGIVNFIHYPDPEIYPPVHELLIKSAGHLIVVSSYRVYADEQHPITEDSPMLLDVVKDKEFLETEKYALSKAKLEKYLRSSCQGQNWTIVRPVISFSKRRFDLVTYSGQDIINLTNNGETVLLPIEAKNVTAGLDWAGNTGKLIANLLFKKNTFGEAYTVSSAQNLTWGEIAQVYTDLLGTRFEWLEMPEFRKATASFHRELCDDGLVYDRLFDRRIDNSKILRATGLTKEDFLPMRKGLEIELSRLKKEGR